MKNQRARHRNNRSGRTLPMAARCALAVIACASLARAQSPSERAWVVLQAGAAEKSTDKRAAAVGVLKLIPKDARAVPIAEKALDDPRPEVRAAAAVALGEMQSKDSVPLLKKALNDKEVSVALAAARSLISFGDRDGYEIYYEVLTGERKGGRGLVGEQLETFKDPKKLAQFGFEEAIGFVPFAGMGYGAFKALRKKDASPVRAAAAKVLAGDPDPSSSRALLRATVDKNWLVRVAALEAIASRNDSSLAPEIEPILADEKDVVRYTAAAVLIRLSNLKAEPSPGM